MTVGFEPSPEMIEAGARALCETASDGIDNYDDLDDVAQEMFREWSEANLRAALGLVLSDPCPTCGDTGRVSLPSPTRWVDGVQITDTIAVYGPCPDCPRRVWAWLRAAQNSGVIEPGAFDHDTGEWVARPFFPDDVPAFRVSVPYTPEES